MEASAVQQTMETQQPKHTSEKQNQKKPAEGKALRTGGGKKKAGVISSEPIAGVRDFPPEEMRKRTWLFDKFREVARVFSFQEYDAPVLEYEELYTRKAGEEITQQMYNFVDKGDQKVSLRPEMTPSLARLVIQKGKALMVPVKWFSIPQCWRFETVTRGRRREHYQWNMDIIGVKEVTAEAELLAAVVAFFKSVGLTSKEIGIKVSSRKVIEKIIDDLKIPKEVFAQTCIIVDKLDKLERADVVSQLGALEPTPVPEETANRLIDTLSVKSIEELGALIGEEHEAVKELRKLFWLAQSYGYADWIQFDSSVVRGLAYYTGIVFEGFDRTGGIPRAICGGGRYDRLFSTYGARDIPSCGFGFGDCVIMEILEDRKLLPNFAPRIDDVILAFSEDLRPVANELAMTLRMQGRAIEIVLGEGKKLKWAYSYADRLGADRVLLIAPDEWKERKIRVKDMKVGSKEQADNQYDVLYDDFVRQP
jgi:histidyl-tRNA synthetase